MEQRQKENRRDDARSEKFIDVVELANDLVLHFHAKDGRSHAAEIELHPAHDFGFRPVNLIEARIQRQPPRPPAHMIRAREPRRVNEKKNQQHENRIASERSENYGGENKSAEKNPDR